MTTISGRLIQVLSKAVPNERLGSSGRRSSGLLAALEQRLVQFATAHGIGSMRLSLAIIFVWFGLLKLGYPASEFSMVIGTTYWFPLPPVFLLPLFGLAEIFIGLTVLFAGGVLLRLGLHFLMLHMVATFVVLFMMPDLVFRNDNPLLLTNAGEYVIKNLTLMAGALVVFANRTASEKRADGNSANGERVNGHEKGPIDEIERTGALSTPIRPQISNGVERDKNGGIGDGGAHS